MVLHSAWAKQIWSDFKDSKMRKLSSNFTILKLNLMLSRLIEINVTLHLLIEFYVPSDIK